MKPFIILLMIALGQLTAFGQVSPWANTKDWKIYDLVGSAALRISVDSLKQLKGKPVSSDDIKYFLSDAKAIERKDNPVWMGAYLMTYVDSTDTLRKFLISNYGGFVFDRRTKTHYLLQEQKWDSWRKFYKKAHDLFYEDIEDEQ